MNAEVVFEIVKNVLKSIKWFFSDARVVVVTALLLLSISANCGGYYHVSHKDKQIEKARKDLELSMNRTLKLKAKAEFSAKAYEDFQKKMKESLKKNQKLTKSIVKQKAKLKVELKKESKRIDKMGLGDLVKEFNKAGYGTTNSPKKEK